MEKAIEEASVWMALLHGPRQRRNLAEGFYRWKMERPEHAAAFEAVTSMWEISGRLNATLLARQKRADFSYGLKWAVSGVAATVIAVCGILLWMQRSAGVVTGVGEQRTLALPDGSRVYLNTDTKLHISYSGEKRLIELDRGEALFEVAKDKSRPFIVAAGDRNIEALGTSFVVRRDETQLAVTLVEGKILVSPFQREGEAKTGGVNSLLPGERLILKTGAAPALDSPQIEKVTAWRQGRIELRDTPLKDAIAEMNRYSSARLEIADPAAFKIPVTGAFRVGDAMSLAESVANACAMHVVREDKRIVLSGEPAANCR